MGDDEGFASIKRGCVADGGCYRCGGEASEAGQSSRPAGRSIIAEVGGDVDGREREGERKEERSATSSGRGLGFGLV